MSTPASAAAQTSYSQRVPPCFTPEPSLMRSSDLQAQLRYDTPVNGTSSTKAPGDVISHQGQISVSRQFVFNQGSKNVQYKYKYILPRRNFCVYASSIKRLHSYRYAQSYLLYGLVIKTDFEEKLVFGTIRKLILSVQSL